MYHLHKGKLVEYWWEEAVNRVTRLNKPFPNGWKLHWNSSCLKTTRPTTWSLCNSGPDSQLNIHALVINKLKKTERCLCNFDENHFLNTERKHVWNGNVQHYVSVWSNTVWNKSKLRLSWNYVIVNDFIRLVLILNVIKMKHNANIMYCKAQNTPK